MADTSMRYLILLGLLPKHLPGIGTSEVQEKLRKKGYRVTQRTIQRDLEKLSAEFPIVGEQHGNRNLWRFQDNALPVTLPAMDSNTALIMKLARKHLKHDMPSQVFNVLESHFQLADKVIKDNKRDLNRWQDRVRVINSEFSLLRPEVRSGVAEQLTQAVVSQTQCEVRYKMSPSDSAKKYCINPLAIISKDDVNYVLATLDSQAEILQMPMQYFSSVKPVDAPCNEPADFDLDSYLGQGNMGVIEQDEKVRMVLKVSPVLANMLKDQALGSDQEIMPADDSDYSEVVVTVDNSDSLKRWLISWGEELEVIYPDSMRQSLADMTQSLVSRYLNTSDKPATA